MNNTIDQKVVELKFNNRQFEEGVKTSLDSINKLKQGLDLTGAAKGFEDINLAAKKTDLSGITNAVQTLQLKFSAFEVMAVTALANITNSAINAGKRIAASLTIDPIKKGYSEYETQINSTQTILANTQSTTKKASQEAISAINATAATAVETAKQTSKSSIENLKKSQKQELKEYEKTSSAELDVIENKHEQESKALQKAIDTENKSLSKAHQEKLDLYEEEYMAKLKSIDEERYNEIKAIDDQIDSINGLTQAEEEAREQAEQTEKIYSLMNRIDNAASADERSEAEKDLADYRQELAYKQAKKERDAQIETLNINKEQIKEKYSLAEDNLKNEYSLKKDQESEAYSALLEKIKEEQALKKESLRTTYDTEKQMIKDRQEIEKDALDERQSAAMDALNSYNETALKNIDERKTAEIRALSSVNGEKTKSTTLEDVTKALDTLNEYADKTIYNFTEMTRNIGTFTAAGVGLDASVNAIKGISNLAALSGSTSQQASSVMYQLSQALASGTVKLLDWNSVVSGGMGGQVFQDSLTETARVHGVAIDDMIASEGSFRNTLEKGWLTSDILTETLSKFTGDLNADQLRTIGYSEEQITSIIKMGSMANDAATKVKTFTQLWETLKEAAQSGWAKSWQIVIGDFEEAKSLLTELGGVLGGFVQASADARNEALKGWKDLGGRKVLIDAFKNSFEGIMQVIKSVAEAFKEIFPSITGKQLYELTEKFKILTEKFKMSDETARNLKNTFKGLFALLDIGGQAVAAVFNAMKPLVGFLGEVGLAILGVTGPLGEYIVSLDETIKKTDSFNEAFKKIGELLKPVVDKIKDAVDNIKEAFASFKDVDLSAVNSLTDRVQARFEPFTKLGELVKNSASKISEVLEKLEPVFSKIREAAAKVSKGIQDALSKAFEDFDFDSMFDIINGGLFSLILLGIKRFVNSLTGVVDEGKGIFKGVNSVAKSISGIFDGVRESLKAFQTQLKADALYKIAGAMALLTASVFVLSLIDSKKLTLSLGAMSGMFIELFGSLAIFEKIVGSKSFASMMKVTTSLVGLSVAILLLSFAMKNLSELDWNGIAKGLVGVAGLSAILVESAKVLSKNSGKMISGSIGLVIFAGAISILVNSVKELGALDIGSLAKGLIGVGVLLTELAIFMKLTDVNKMGIGKGLGLLILAEAINILADATSKFASLDVANLSKGLGAIALVLAELAIFVNTTGNASKVISTAIGLTILGAALLIISNAVSNMGKMSWEQIAKGLLTMAGALTLITVAMNFMPKDMILTGAGLVIVASALIILSKALSSMGGMSWEQIGKGLVVLAGSLTIIAVAMNFMTTALPGAAALLIVSSALTILTKALLSLGSMSLTEIGKGLLALAGTFTVIGVAALVLSPIIPVILALAGAVALLGVGLLAIGAGTLLFSSGLAALAISGVAGAAALVVIVTSIIGLIPLILEKIGEGIILLCNVITAGAPAIAESVYTVVATTIASLMATIPMVVDGVLTLLTTILETIAVYMPRIVEAGWSIIVSFLEGIANNTQAVVEIAMEIVTGFINGVAEKLPELIDAGFNLMINFIDGLADAIDKNTPTMISAVENLFSSLINAGKLVLESSVSNFMDVGSAIMNSGFIQGIQNEIQTVKETVGSILEKCVSLINEKISAFKEAGKNVIEGFINGLREKINAIKETTSDVANTVIDNMKDLFGIHSPSKVFFGIAANVVTGFSNGIKKYSSLAETTTSEFANKSISCMTDAVSNIMGVLNGDMSNTPTISPVLDLSKVRREASKIDGIVNSDRSLSVSGSFDKAIHVSTNLDETSNTRGEVGNTYIDKSVHFEQTNESPEALNAYEIHKNTIRSLQLINMGV